MDNEKSGEQRVIMEKTLNYNKVTIPAIVNAFVLLLNSKLPLDWMLTGDEIGWAIMLVTALVTYLVPNQTAQQLRIKLDTEKVLQKAMEE